MYAPQNYTLTAGNKYSIKGYRFEFANAGHSDALTVSTDGKSMTSSSSYQNFAVDGLKEATASFTLNGANKGLTLKNFYVTVSRSLSVADPGFEVFGTQDETVVNRIPALAQAQNGDLIAVADYRYSGHDIGMVANGVLDIRGRISKDNGQTWGPIFTIAKGTGSGGSGLAAFNHAYGDPCLVADRESSKVIMMSCSGNISFPNGSDANHQDIAYFVSNDNGATWAAPVRITDQFYDQLRNSSRGPVRAMFIGSGKIHQSRYTKVGNYYRLYCSALVKDKDGVNCNYVYYSDDFGLTWTVLGDPNTPAVPSGTDEPKVEELPDGTVMVNARKGGGRFINFFTFANAASGEGSWGSVAVSDNTNQGTYGASCNGEILLVPAVRKADNKQVWMALMSLPAASSRTNVSIYYKELDSYNEDFKDAATFAKNWDGKFKVSSIGSAYSTMVLKQDKRFGFFYEEDRYNVKAGYQTVMGYAMIYKDFSLEQITDSAYSVAANFDHDAYFRTIATDVVANAATQTGEFVGMYKGNPTETVASELQTCNAAPTMGKFEALKVALLNQPRIEIDPTQKYTLFNKLKQAYLSLKSAGDGLTSTTGEPTDTEYFTFVPAGDGNWYIKLDGQEKYLGSAPARFAFFPLGDLAQASKFVITSTPAGLSVMASTTPTEAGYPAVHLSNENNIVPWTTVADASMWYVKKAGTATSIDAVKATNSNVKVYDLQGRRVTKPSNGLYIVDGKKMIF